MNFNSFKVLDSGWSLSRYQRDRNDSQRDLGSIMDSLKILNLFFFGCFVKKFVILFYWQGFSIFSKGVTGYFVSLKVCF